VETSLLSKASEQQLAINSARVTLWLRAKDQVHSAAKEVVCVAVSEFAELEHPLDHKPLFFPLVLSLFFNAFSSHKSMHKVFYLHFLFFKSYFLNYNVKRQSV
jgi:hypothetical protein